MLDLGKVECTTALEVKLLAELLFERRQRQRLTAGTKPKPSFVPRGRLRFLPPPPDKFTFAKPAETYSIKDIQDAVAQRFRTTIDEMLSARRHHHTMLARHAAMLLCHLLTQRSYPEIGRMFGRDHTTVLYAVKTRPDVAEHLRTNLSKSDPLECWADEVFHRLVPKGQLAKVTNLSHT